MNLITLNIREEFETPIQIEVYEFAKRFFIFWKNAIGTFILSILLIVFSPIWVTVLFYMFRISNNKLEKSLKIFRERNATAERSKDLFDFYKITLTYKEVFEQNGKFRRPKKYKIFRPFFIQLERFYNLQSAHADWLRAKLYPTYEELGISKADFEFVRKQIQPGDFEDASEYVDYEAKFFLN